VSSDEGRTLAQKYGAMFLEISSKENKNVSELFELLSTEIKRF